MNELVLLASSLGTKGFFKVGGREIVAKADDSGVSGGVGDLGGLSVHMLARQKITQVFLKVLCGGAGTGAMKVPKQNLLHEVALF